VTPRLPAPIRLAALLALAFALASPAAAVEVQEVRWGFDGKVVPERINVLSILLSNDSNRTFDSVLTLSHREGLGGRVGPEFVEPCFLAPFTSRWVQFCPYIGDANEEWNITLGRRGFGLPEPSLGAPAAVCLTDPDDPLQGRPALRAFPENLFPLTVAATDGLAAVALDHAPRWEAARQAALLDWLRRGGTLHLLKGQDGDYPRFGGDLSILNDPAERFRVGAGLVVRHRAGRGEVNAETLARVGCPLPTLDASDWSYRTLDERILAALSDLVRPDHNWSLMYVGLIVYMLLIGPVNYLIGRRAARYRLAIAFFVCTAAFFAWGMGTLGRRGFGEAACVHSVAYAEPVDEENYDVTQWLNVFVTHGDYYTLSHAGAHNLYAACERYDAVNAVVESGGGGRLYADIPLFSNRPFLHRGRLKGHALGLQVGEWRQQRDLQALTLSVGPGFPEDFVDASVLHRDRFWSMRRRGDTLCLADGRPRSRGAFLSEERTRLDRRRYRPSQTGVHDLGKVAPNMGLALVARAIGELNDMGRQPKPPPAGDDEAQLFLLTESPPGFALRAEDLGRQVGYVLYHVRLFRPEDTDG
jgi:hypothetical protein